MRYLLPARGIPYNEWRLHRQDGQRGPIVGSGASTARRKSCPEGPAPGLPRASTRRWAIRAAIAKGADPVRGNVDAIRGPALSDPVRDDRGGPRPFAPAPRSENAGPLAPHEGSRLSWRYDGEVNGRGNPVLGGRHQFGIRIEDGDRFAQHRPPSLRIKFPFDIREISVECTRRRGVRLPRTGDLQDRARQEVR